MAPLMCASVSDLYGSNFGLSAEQIAEKTLKKNQECAENNTKYQQELKENVIAGKANFVPPNSISSTNNSEFAKRIAYTDKYNNWPSNQGFSMFNRFQHLLGTRENYTTPMNDSECLQQLVSIAHDIQLILRIIMFVLKILIII